MNQTHSDYRYNQSCLQHHIIYDKKVTKLKYFFLYWTFRGNVFFSVNSPCLQYVQWQNTYPWQIQSCIRSQKRIPFLFNKFVSSNIKTFLKARKLLQLKILLFVTNSIIFPFKLINFLTKFKTNCIFIYVGNVGTIKHK